jgi:hypothetical protein
MTMKAPWMVLLALICLAPFAARSQGYAFIPYRFNDPFVFCTEGWSPVAVMGWKPLPPYTGAYAVLRPQKFWSFDDWNALWYYMTVCPQAVQPGAWTGPTPADVTPVLH